MITHRSLARDFQMRSILMETGKTGSDPRLDAINGIETLRR